MYKESEIIELKREYTEDIRKEIIDFVNTYINSYESARSLQQKLTFKRLKHEFDDKTLAFNDPQKRTLGITEFDDIYTNLGLLLSDQCPHELKIAVFQGTDGYIFRDRREIRGALLDQLYEAYEYIDNRNAVKATIEGLHRKDK